MGDIIEFNGTTTLDIAPEQVLEKAKAWEKMDQCLVIGINKDLDDLYFSGSTSDVPLTNYLLDLAKRHLLNDDDVPDGGRHA